MWSYRAYEEARERKGVTDYRVAKDCGIPTGALYNWKAGRYEPKYDKIARIASYLGVTVAGLSDGDGGAAAGERR